MDFPDNMDLMGSMEVHGVCMEAHIPGRGYMVVHGVCMEAFTEVMDSMEAFTPVRILDGVSMAVFTGRDGGDKSVQTQKDSDSIILSESFCVCFIIIFRSFKKTVLPGKHI